MAWMKERLRNTPVHRVEQHARMADRLLEWMKTNGHVPRNPLQELRCEYGKRLGPIVRALLSDNPDSGLEKLRPAGVRQPTGPADAPAC